MNKENKSAPVWFKLIVLVLIGVMGIIAGMDFWNLRHYKESLVASEGLTKQIMLSDYLPSLKGTWGDTPIYVYDSGVPGGVALLMGGTHPYEPATMMAGYILAENMKVEKGKVFVVPVANRSANTLGMLGNAYPMFYTIDTAFGPKQYKIGDRNTNPLDQWPDPFTYVHYPSGQNLTYQDMRNFNRTWPGRADGTLTERVSYAFMELMRKEKVDIYFDYHEASLMYPVVDTYVAHNFADEISLLAQMTLDTYKFPMKAEASPKKLRGLSHREVGDYAIDEELVPELVKLEMSGYAYDYDKKLEVINKSSHHTFVLLMETLEPFIERVAGRVTVDLLMEGNDEFIQTAADKKLLFARYDSREGITMPIDEDGRGGYVVKGAPMYYRVARHLEGTKEAIKWMSMLYPDKELILDFPGFHEIMEPATTKGNAALGDFLHDPATSDPSRVFYQ